MDFLPFTFLLFALLIIKTVAHPEAAHIDNADAPLVHEQTEAADCPGIDGCINCCPLGRQRDIKGCLICDCLKSGLVQGDIIITENDYEDFFKKYGVVTKNEHSRHKRGAFQQEFRHWPKKGNNKNVIIPYVFESMSGDMQENVRKAIEDFKLNTCVRFVPRKSETDHIVFNGNTKGCASFMGRIGGKQTINLGPSCNVKGNILHEMMHSIGFAHEQARPDRDEHVNIIWSNIMAVNKMNFGKEIAHVWDSYDSPYDLNSLMHYGSYYFSSNDDKPTITDKDGNIISVNRVEFSRQDLLQINRKYDCPESYIKRAMKRKTATTTTITPTESPKNLVCEDKQSSAYCSIYAKKGQCNLETLKDNLKIFCAKTCKFCTPTEEEKVNEESDCVDKSKSCLVMKLRGHCSSSKSFMEINCKKSCKLCIPTNVSPMIVSNTKQTTTTMKLTTTIKPTTTAKPTTTTKPTTTKPRTAKPTTVKKTTTKKTTTTTKPATTAKPTTTVKPTTVKKTTTKRTTTVKPTTVKKTTTTTTKPATTTKPTTTVKPTTVKKTTTKRTTTKKQTTQKTTTTTKPATTTVKLTTPATTTEPTTTKKTTTEKPTTTTTKPTTTSKKTTTTKPRTTTVQEDRVLPLTEKVESEVCSDKLEQCPEYVKFNYCTSLRYRYKMRIHCKKSCGYCRSKSPLTTTTSATTTTTTNYKKKALTTTTTTPTTQVETTTKQICQDKQKNCVKWARRQYCTEEKYKQVMILNCRKSCGFCTEDESTENNEEDTECKNKKKFCSSWANMGRCTQVVYERYLTENCPLSCNKCPNGNNKKSSSVSKSTGVKSSGMKPTKLGRNADGCADNYRHCADWAEKGRCERNVFKLYMTTNCRKSCGFC